MLTMSHWSSPLKLFIDLEQGADSDTEGAGSGTEGAASRTAGDVDRTSPLARATAQSISPDVWRSSTAQSMSPDVWRPSTAQSTSPDVWRSSPAQSMSPDVWRSSPAQSRSPDVWRPSTAQITSPDVVPQSSVTSTSPAVGPVRRYGSPTSVTAPAEYIPIPRQRGYLGPTQTAASTMAGAALERSPPETSPTGIGWLHEGIMQSLPIHDDYSTQRQTPLQGDSPLYVATSPRQPAMEYNRQRMRTSPHQPDSGYGSLHMRTLYKESPPWRVSPHVPDPVLPEIVHRPQIRSQLQVGLSPHQYQEQLFPQPSAISHVTWSYPSVYPALRSPRARAGPLTASPLTQPDGETARTRSSDVTGEGRRISGNTHLTAAAPDMPSQPTTSAIETLCQLMQMRAIHDSSSTSDTGAITLPSTRRQVTGLLAPKSTVSELVVTSPSQTPVPNITTRDSTISTVPRLEPQISMSPPRYLYSPLPSDTSPRIGHNIQELFDLSCNFCKRNGERKRFYKAHNLMDKNGNIVCPILRKYVCPLCGATGAVAHTVSYCPLGRGESAVAASRTPKKSCGCNRECKHGRTKKH